MSRHDTIGSHRTTIASDSGYVVVTYHSTQVVKFSPTQVILNSGGYHTATTKSRINQTARQFDLPYTLYAVSYMWYVDLVYAGAILSTKIPFSDNMMITRRASDGYPTNITIGLEI